ncbi:hypothetical protein GGS21DRAFT_524011 [Xylaria nigripes]|nr:hypothetical protein GGS21DRAFT_524011 [Xylaria nigripes]
MLEFGLFGRRLRIPADCNETQSARGPQSAGRLFHPPKKNNGPLHVFYYQIVLMVSLPFGLRSQAFFSLFLFFCTCFHLNGSSSSCLQYHQASAWVLALDTALALALALVLAPVPVPEPVWAAV